MLKDKIWQSLHLITMYNNPHTPQTETPQTETPRTETPRTETP